MIEFLQRQASANPSIRASCCASVLVWLLVFALLQPDHLSLLNWDEVDYVNAANLGVKANAWETGSLSPREFVDFGLSKVRREVPVLPTVYDEQHDPFILRHHHPPLVIFLLGAVAGSRSESVIRSVQLLGALIFVFAMMFSYRGIARPPRWSGTIVVSIFTIWMSRLAFGTISFHGWEALWATTIAALLALLSVSGGISPTWVGIGLGGVLALALLTLETGLVLWGVVIMWLLVADSYHSGGRRFWIGMRSVLLTLAVAAFLVALIWPGSVVKMSVFKTIATRLYVVQLGKEYARVPYWTLVQVLLPVAGLGLVSAAWLLRNDVENCRRWGPFVAVGIVYGIALIPFAVQVHYLIPAVAPLVCVVALASGSLSRKMSRSVAVTLCGIAVVAAWPSGQATFDEKSRQDLQLLGRVLRDRESLVDGGHIYQHYLGPDYRIRPITVDYEGRFLSIRERGEYHNLGERDVAGRIVVIQASRPDFLRSDIHMRMLERCSRTDQFSIKIYDCDSIVGSK